MGSHFDRVPQAHADQQWGRLPGAGRKGAEWGMAGEGRAEDSLAPSREPAGAPLGFAKEKVARPEGLSWTKLSGHFLCSPHHGSAVGIAELGPFPWCPLQTCPKRLGALNQQAGPGLGLVRGVRPCTLVSFQGDLCPTPASVKPLTSLPHSSGQPSLSLSPAVRWEVGSTAGSSPSSTTNLLSTLRKISVLCSLFSRNKFWGRHRRGCFCGRFKTQTRGRKKNKA